METTVLEADILGLDDITNVEVEDLVTEDVNLIFLGIDSSGSMQPFERIMPQELEKFKKELGSCKQSDQILVSRANFSDGLQITGYQKVNDIDTGYSPRNMTILYDTIIAGGNELMKYMDELKSQGVRVRAAFAIFSDGEDTASRLDFHVARTMVDQLNKREIITAYMEFGDAAKGMGKYLGFRNIMTTGGTGDELRAMFALLSTSVVQFSQSIKPKDDFFAV